MVTFYSFSPSGIHLPQSKNTLLVIGETTLLIWWSRWHWKVISSEQIKPPLYTLGPKVLLWLPVVSVMDLMCTVYRNLSDLRGCFKSISMEQCVRATTLYLHVSLFSFCNQLSSASNQLTRKSSEQLTLALSLSLWKCIAWLSSGSNTSFWLLCWSSL